MSELFFIGDVQGCYEQLCQLLELIERQAPGARLLFAGDLINRGPQSLDCLRLVRRLQLAGRADSVLGNHDLHLLAVAQGIRAAHHSDTLDEILQAPDRDELLDWLRARPLALLEQGHLLIHAGLFPQWSSAQTLALAAEVEAMLRSDNWGELLRQMYGNLPDRWDASLQGADRRRCIINALTRMRFCSADGRMDFTCKDNAASAPPGCSPWFELPRASRDAVVVFGHWSTLGLQIRDDMLSLDSGCVWGGQLSAVALSDHRLLQVSSPQHRQPGGGPAHESS